MKKRLSFLLVCVMLLTTLSVFSGVSAETPNTIYLSDSGNDANDGLTKDTPVRCIKTAVTKLGGNNAVGTVCVVGTYTYCTSSNNFHSGGSAWLFPTAKHLTITGADENAVFYMNRGNAGTGGDVVFTNIKYKSKTHLYAHNSSLTFASDVTMVPVNASVDPSSSSYRNEFPIVSVGRDTAVTKNSAVYLNGGSYNYVYAIAWGTMGTETAPIQSTMVIGKNATVMHSVHIGNSASVVHGDVYVEIDGNVKVNLNFNTATINGNMKVKFGKNASFGGAFCKVNGSVYEKVDLSGIAAMFADGKSMTVDACRNKTVSNKVSEVITNNGFRMIPYIENAPVFVGTQIRENTETFDARFAATIDTLDYTNVGFKVTATWGENESKVLDTECRKVYTALTAIVEGKSENETAAEYEGVYIYALTVQGVPTNVGAITFTVTPYAVNGADTYTGNTFTVVCTPGANGVAVA